MWYYWLFSGLALLTALFAMFAMLSWYQQWRKFGDSLIEMFWLKSTSLFVVSLIATFLYFQGALGGAVLSPAFVAFMGILIWVLYIFHAWAVWGVSQGWFRRGNVGYLKRFLVRFRAWRIDYIRDADGPLRDWIHWLWHWQDKN